MKAVEFDPSKNYLETLKNVGYISLENASQMIYNKYNFKSGLEIYQQLSTQKKLFCHCSANISNQNNQNYNSEIVKSMFPDQIELNKYDETALMEFKTKKEITYLINENNVCTYENNELPPIINKEALNIALEIAVLGKFKIQNEIQISCKQYLDGSIPSCFQRGAILGVDGEIQLKDKKVRLIQISIEEDSCREISDIGHKRIYNTDRFGIPQIEIVTYPDMNNPNEVRDTCNYIRFLNRSTNKVKTGMGASRQDINISCKDGAKVEIKGVSHINWIPKLAHNEYFRQLALLSIRKELLQKIKDYKTWDIDYAFLNFDEFKITTIEIITARDLGHKLVAVNLPGFKGILSHFTQPGKVFADEISDKLKVIACIEKPNMVHTELYHQPITPVDLEIIKLIMLSDDDRDAIIVFWAPEEDVQTAIEVIKERCIIAFEGVPRETRKALKDGTTVFERIISDVNKRYTDHNSPSINIETELINNLKKNIHISISEKLSNFDKWNIPKSMYVYLLSKNLYTYVEKAITKYNIEPKNVAKLFGQELKFVETHFNMGDGFEYLKILDMFKFIKNNNLQHPIEKLMLQHVYMNPNIDFNSILDIINFKKMNKNDIISKIDLFCEKFDKEAKNNILINKVNWIMGQIKPIAIGNICLKELREEIIKKIS